MVADWGSLDSTSYAHNFSDLVIENNFIHEAKSPNTFSVGYCKDKNIFPDGSLNYYLKTTSEFNNHSATWRGVGSVTNWENDNSDLFKGDSGSEQYKTNGSFEVGGATTISNGGKAVSHPYLSGITIPPYIGATNPNKDSGSNWDPNNPDPDDAGWVDYVLSIADINNLKSGGISQPSTPPNPPSGLKIVD